VKVFRYVPVVAASILWGSVAPAQTVDPSPIYDPYSAQSPFVLLRVPADGVAYYEARTRAQALQAAKSWQEAEPLLEKLVRDYARDPVTWRMLAQVKSNLGKHLEAAAAYERTGALTGWDSEFNNGYQAAASYYAAGDRAKAFAKLREMLFERHAISREDLSTASVTSKLREDPEFLQLIGRRDASGWSRDEGWVRDIEHLYQEVKRVNPDYRNRPFPAEFERRYSELKLNVPRLSDEEVFIGMGRMLAVLHQGHITLYAEADARNAIRLLPVRFYVFPEGIHIIAADEGFKHLIGSRVLSIGSLSAEEALRRVNQATSVDGDMEHLQVASRLAVTFILKGIGAIKTADSATLQIQGRSGAPQTLSLPAAPSSNFNATLPAPPRVPTPLFLAKLQQKHWEQSLPEREAVYVQVNGLVADQDETLPQFGERLWSVLEESAPKNLILDLRHNGGGSTQSYPQLLRTLVAFTRRSGNQLYVLIGRQTYSAAGNLVTDLERLADPVFVGEASSECCNLYGDATLVLLPYSRMRARVTALRWQLSTPADRRREMSPEVPVQLTAKAYFAGEDPALEAVFRLISASQGKMPAR
jgi:tetratricopeptide (TPR) repeat protein